VRAIRERNASASNTAATVLAVLDLVRVAAGAVLTGLMVTVPPPPHKEG
jgi:hypothetical protein